MPISYRDNQKRLLDEIEAERLTDYKKSAVTLPLVFEGGEWQLIMTQRAGAISYGGQITFPGGKVDGEETIQQAALREGKEEINLDPKKLSIVDALDKSVTQVKQGETLKTYTMEPVVGIIHDLSALEELKPSPGEVERIIKVPVRLLLAAVTDFKVGTKNALELVEKNGVSQYQFTLPDPDQAGKSITIGNVTAGIIFDFMSRFREEQAMKDYMDAKAKHAKISGKKILVLGGSPTEVIDGVRHYANHGRDEAHGAQVAQALADAGAQITFVTAKSHAKKPQGAETISTQFNHRPIISADELIHTAGLEGLTKDFDAVVNLANISAVRPKTVSDKKLKVKKEAGQAVTFEVVGNVDVQERLAQLFPKAEAIAGYDNQQQWFGAGNAELAQVLHAIADQHHTKPIAPTVQKAAQHIPSGGKLAGKKIIITSGPTAETISTTGDVISNFSSGRQGHSVAEALAKMGAQIVLVSGPTHLPDPAHPNIRTVHVDSAITMKKACTNELPAAAFVGVAAVADFGMNQPTPLKLKEGEAHTIELSQNPDILQTMGNLPSSERPTVVVGFAAETHDLIKYAEGKLEKKGADFIVANEVGDTMVKRGSHLNKVTLVKRDGNQELPEMTKDQVGEVIGDQIAMLLLKSKSVQPADITAAPTARLGR